jgi:hypothetical protein
MLFSLFIVLSGFLCRRVIFQSATSTGKRAKSLRVLASMSGSGFEPQTANTRDLQYAAL